MEDPTRELFAAIAAYATSAAYRDPERDRDALVRIGAALAQGADWTALLGPGGRDAAMTAATRADALPLELLFAYGVPVTHAAGLDGSLIHRAAAFGRVAVIEALVARGVAPDLRDGSGRTPLSHARGWNHGREAIRPLVALMQEHGCVPAPARRGQDLRADVVRAAVDTLELDEPTRSALRPVVDAFFVECLAAALGTNAEALGR